MRKQIVAIAGIVLLTAGLALGYDWYIHERWYAREPAKDFALSKLIADIRMATRRYLDVEQARVDGYTQISGNVPLEGYHFHNPAIGQFDSARPSTLLYARTDEQWQLVGLEYAVPGERPAESPFPGVAWERHLAMCRYGDWREFPARAADACPRSHPETKSPFTAWYPDLWVIHLWLWYPNPYGLFASLNPLLAPFDDRTIPPDEAGSWAEWKAHTDFSNFNHNVSGWLVLLMGFAMIVPVVWGAERRSGLNVLWAALALGLAAFILYRSDPTAWPHGVRTLGETLADRETIEHKLSGLIVLGMGTVEWLRVRGTLSHWAWGLIFPWLALTGGTILLFHLHPVSNFNYLGRNNLPHVTEGITAILAGATYLLGVSGIMTQWWWRLVPAGLVILMGIQLILYLE
ncbi:MAG: hypothetical protein HYV46_06160 [candidate division NC10 bacterium]|nr:hypothetical protein [candidate division NC10 bacterium]